MHLPMIALLLAAPTPQGDAFCNGLRKVVDAAPDGFSGITASLDNPVTADGFSCSVGNPESDHDPVMARHLDFVCETSERPGDEASLARDVAALDARIDSCQLPLAMRVAKNGPLMTPYALIAVDSWIVPGESRAGPPPATLTGLRLTVHQLRKR